MEFNEDTRVIGRDGELIGTVVDVDKTDTAATLNVRRDETGENIRIPMEVVIADSSSAHEVVVDVTSDELQQAARSSEDSSAEGSTNDSATPSDPVETIESGGTATLSLVEEQLHAATRDVRTGQVVVRKQVETVPYETTINVEHDEVDVVRVPMDRDLEEVPEVRYDGDTVIVPVFQEVLVIEKRLRLVEEVRVTKRRVAEKQAIQEELRREVLNVVEEDNDGKRPE